MGTAMNHGLGATDLSPLENYLLISLMLNLYLLTAMEKSAHVHQEICTAIFIVTVIMVAQNWKRPKCPSVEYIFEVMVYLYYDIIYSNGNKQPPHTAIWVYLIGTMLSDRIQMQKGYILNDSIYAK